MYLLLHIIVYVNYFMGNYIFMGLPSVKCLCFFLDLQLNTQSFPYLVIQQFVDAYYVPCSCHLAHCPVKRQESECGKT